MFIDSFSPNSEVFLIICGISAVRMANKYYVPALCLISMLWIYDSEWRKEDLTIMNKIHIYNSISQKNNKIINSVNLFWFECFLFSVKYCICLRRRIGNHWIKMRETSKLIGTNHIIMNRRCWSGIRHQLLNSFNLWAFHCVSSFPESI